MNTRAKLRLRSFLLLLSLFLLSGTLVPVLAEADTPINVWWPTNGSHMQGVQPFKAMIPGLDVSEYDIYWQVDGGQLNTMDNNYTDYQHKEASVDLSGWQWHGSGPYVINFVAKKNGQVIEEQSETIYIDNNLPAYIGSQNQPTPNQPTQTPDPVVTPAPVTNPVPPVSVDPDPVHAAQAQAAQVQTVSQPTQTQTVTPPQTSTTAKIKELPASSASNALSGMTFYVNPNGSSAKMISALQVISSQPTATWFGNWNSNIQDDVHKIVAAAEALNETPVMVAYNLPGRDCGGYSGGTNNDPVAYRNWIQQFTAGIGNSKAIVILEPDSLAQIDCLSGADQQLRLNLIANAVTTLKTNSNTKVYLDAGHSGWISAQTMASRLIDANIGNADGFALNVSNFDATNDEVTYGTDLSNLLNGKHFVVDTSRNGNGSNGEWCNPGGRALGTKPTINTGNPLVDAFLWIKTPGESDGNCNGGPSAGVFWYDYAMDLVKNSH